ncbi:SDR family oxidoreductase [Nocardioides mangrovicus]|uniref:SDR family oxidoreductase n=1 Tax=Nocardioides mangrovicus TaxID=2478913 RepID=A0A3L8P4Q1_9ACTN|nr:SDR family NAD(P)-dependent oxidoreductase [Nocardioides mangrovicus]RLV49967.1 SDR family oxidoreductase [Nocardioides mangrovicus]
MGRLAGKVALVTGTAGGIGRAVALSFVREGATVVCCDLDADGSRETAALAEGDGVLTTTAPIDLTDPSAAVRWADQAAAEHGGIDILVNNASAIRFGAIDRMPVEDWRFTISHELDIVFYVTRAVWPHLVARGGGSIVNIASLSASRGAFFMAQNAHGAAKGGVLALTYQLVAEGGPSGIRVNAVSPGMTATPQTRQHLEGPGSDRDVVTRRIPLGKVGQPDDVAAAVLFLASDEAGHVSGANIPVDGGSATIG